MEKDIYETMRKLANSYEIGYELATDSVQCYDAMNFLDSVKAVHFLTTFS